MKNLVIGILIVLYVFSNKELKAQDPHFSQFYAVPLYLAPSFAGASSKKTRVALNYRNQWPQIPGGFTTYSMSFDHFVSKIRSGIGVLAIRDQSGVGNLSLTNVGLQYSFDFQVNQDIHIRPGAHFMYTQRGIDFEKLQFYDELLNNTGGTGASTIILPPEKSKGDVDFSTSIVSYADNYWAGFTFDHLLTPNQSLYGNVAEVPIKMTAFGGFKYLLKERLMRKHEESVTFTYLFKSQKDFRQLDIGAYYYKFPMMFGFWYRGLPVWKEYPGSDALIFLLGYKLDNVSIGYSYDYTISQLRNNTAGSHELALIWSFKLQKWDKRPSSLPCPEF